MYIYKQMETNRLINDLETFLSQIFPNEEIGEHVLEYLSQIVNGTCNERKITVFEGIGGNGKSIFCNLIQKMMGEQCESVSSEDLYDDNFVFDEVYNKLANKKFIICHTDRNGVSAKMKALMSNDQLLNGKTPQCNIILCRNDPFKCECGGLRRVQIIKFESRFVSEPNPNNPKEFKCEFMRDKIEQWGEIFRNKLLKQTL